MSRAQFSDRDPAGAFIPGAVGTVASAGAALDGWRGVFGALRVRHVGSRALVQDGSRAIACVHAGDPEAGYRLRPGARVGVDVLNVLNVRTSDIAHYYTSRLRDEPAAGFDDIHGHPAPPRTVRVMLQVGFYPRNSLG